MAKHQEYYKRFKQKKFRDRLLTSLSIIFVVGLFAGAGAWLSSVTEVSPKAFVVSIGNKVMKIASSDSELSNTDKNLYKQIFNLQKAGSFEDADVAISKLSNDILLGDVLAERYLNRRYNTTLPEIILWLKNYPEHTQAADIAELARAKYQSAAANLPKTQKKRDLQGYGDTNNADIRFDSNTQAKKLWSYGIESWRNGKKSDAARFFSSLVSTKEELTPWQESAANFWAYRSYQALGNKAEANKYLVKAAENPRVFYGILARKQLGKKLELDTDIVEANTPGAELLNKKPEIRRIIALTQCELNERAEKQIRQLFPSASKQEKWGLLALANKLGLASAQISMAKQLESSERKLDALKYPVPRWQPEEGFNIEPSLIYALMRQESGFQTSAISPAGAFGLMQLMPKTAQMMHSYYVADNDNNIRVKSSGSDIKKLSDPVMNITLGERYVGHLLGNSLIKGNLFYMLAAYNAGIGRLKEWQDNIAYHDDPLLFVESIPYSETRTYVMQVMTNYWIYSELFGVNNKSVIAVLRNNWPTYLPAEPMTADAGQRNKNS